MTTLRHINVYLRRGELLGGIVTNEQIATWAAMLGEREHENKVIRFGYAKPSQDASEPNNEITVTYALIGDIAAFTHTRVPGALVDCVPLPEEAVK